MRLRLLAVTLLSLHVYEVDSTLLDIYVFASRPSFTARLTAIIGSAVYRVRRVDVYLIVAHNHNIDEKYTSTCASWHLGRCIVTHRWVRTSSAVTRILINDCVEISPFFAVWFSLYPATTTTMGAGPATANTTNGVRKDAIITTAWGVAPTRIVWVDFTRWVVEKKKSLRNTHPLTLFERYARLNNITGIYPIIDNGRLTMVRAMWQDPLQPQTLPYIARVWPDFLPNYM